MPAEPTASGLRGSGESAHSDEVGVEAEKQSHVHQDQLELDVVARPRLRRQRSTGAEQHALDAETRSGSLTKALPVP